MILHNFVARAGFCNVTYLKNTRKNNFGNPWDGKETSIVHYCEKYLNETTVPTHRKIREV